MDLNEMKSQWQSAGSPDYDEERLLKMTRVRNHPMLNRIRIKLIIESSAITLFLVFFYSMLDASSKPTWTIYFLVIAGIGYILADILNLKFLNNKFQDKSIVSSLTKLKDKLETVSFLSISASFLFGIALILFFTIDIDFNTFKYSILAGIVVTFILSTYLSIRMWNNRINILKKHIKQLLE